MVFDYQDFVAIVSRCMHVCVYQKRAVPAYPNENVSIVRKESLASEQAGNGSKAPALD